MFNEAIALISRFPQIGRPTELENIRIKIVRDYLIVKEDTTGKLHALTIIDARPSPETIRKFLR